MQEMNTKIVSPEFLHLMRRSFEFHSGGAITVEAPMLNWSKLDVLSTASQLDVPIARRLTVVNLQTLPAVRAIRVY